MVIPSVVEGRGDFFFRFVNKILLNYLFWYFSPFIHKMKVHLNLTLIFLLNILFANAQDIFPPPLKPNMVLSNTENLVYQIRYGFIVGGYTTFSLSEELYAGKPVFHASAIGETSGIANTLFGVKDIYESWFDKESYLPYKQIRNIKEGHYLRYNEVTYDRKNNTVNSKLSGVHKVPEKILDLTSTFYYIRRVDFSKLKEEDVILINMYFDDEIFPFRLRYKGKEGIKTKFGTISCFKICPVVEVGRMFKDPDDLTIWFSDDDNRVPLLVKMDIRIVGSVLLKLINYKNSFNQMDFLE